MADSPLAALREWTATHQDAISRVDTQELRDEIVVHITPRRADAPHLSVRVARSGSDFDAIIGDHTCFDDITLSEPMLLDVCEAVRTGQLIERTWRRTERVTRVQSTLRLRDGTLHEDRFQSFLYPLWWALGRHRVTEIRHVPWAPNADQ